MEGCEGTLEDCSVQRYHEMKPYRVWFI